jgi:opacity protein-like surface antigen
MPYAFLGGAVGRLNYSVSHNDVVTDAKDNAYTAGFVAGVGIDVALLPNVFLR